MSPLAMPNGIMAMGPLKLVSIAVNICVDVDCGYQRYVMRAYPRLCAYTGASKLYVKKLHVFYHV